MGFSSDDSKYCNSQPLSILAYESTTYELNLGNPNFIEKSHCKTIFKLAFFLVFLELRRKTRQIVKSNAQILGAFLIPDITQGLCKVTGNEVLSQLRYSRVTEANSFDETETGQCQ